MTLPAALIALAVAATALLTSPTAWASVDAPSLDRRLPNGMRILVYEDRKAPTALHMVWIQAGSMDEVNGKTGVAHVLEHMMFKGTKTLQPGEFSRRVSALGGKENAFTSREYTGYFQQIHRDALWEVMRLEADRMQNLRFSDAEFAKEIQVVMEERRLRTDDSASGRLYEALYATAFQASPVRNPIIGWMGDLQTLAAQDARDWYAQVYSPQLATMVVLGDVDAEKVYREARRLYSGWKPRPLAARRPQPEPEPLGRRHVQVSAPAENPFFVLAWPAPNKGPGEPAMAKDDPKSRRIVALGALASLLDHPSFGVLNERLVRGEGRRVLLDVGTAAGGVSRGPELFTLQATPAPGVSLDEAEAALWAEIDRVANEGLSAEAFALVRRLVRAGEVYAKDSLFSRAMEVGQLTIAQRPLSDSRAWTEVLEDLRPEEIQEAARAVLLREKTTRVDLLPTPIDPAAPGPRRGFGPKL